MLRGLFLQIGVLAAGHFVQINFRAARLRRGVERRDNTRAPVPSNRKTRSASARSSPVSRGVCCSAATIEFRFGWLVRAGHRGDREIDHVHARFARLAGSRPTLMPLVSCVWK